MNYLFGDSTPSSLQIDYIDFLRDALDFSAQVLAANERMRAGDQRVIEARRIGEEEAARLEKLGSTVAGSIDGSDVGVANSATAQCAEALLRSAAELVRAAVDRARAATAGELAQIQADVKRDRERCVEALGLFLLRHDLPGMASELRLEQRSGTSYNARLYARALGDLQAVLDLEIAATHPLAHVLRVEKLIERLEVHAPEAGGWLRKEVKLRPQRLDKEYITGFVSGAKETLIQLRTNADGTGVGFDLALRDDSPRVSLHRMGEATGLPPFDLEEADAAKVRDLRDKLVEQTADLRTARKALVEAAVGDSALSDHPEPQTIVERLVALMAPVVQEIARRSLTQTELVLKRQTGDGRREEIFIGRKDLLVKLRSLGEKSRAVFAPLGLGEVPAEEPPTLKRIIEEKPKLATDNFILPPRPTLASSSPTPVPEEVEPAEERKPG